MSNKWTDRLPDLMEGYSEAAPEGLWDAVLAGVEKSRRKVVPFWWVAGAVAVAAAVVLAVFLWKPAVPEVGGLEQVVLADVVIDVSGRLLVAFAHEEGDEKIDAPIDLGIFPAAQIGDEGKRHVQPLAAGVVIRNIVIEVASLRVVVVNQISAVERALRIEALLVSHT